MVLHMATSCIKNGYNPNIISMILLKIKYLNPIMNCIVSPDVDVALYSTKLIK